MIKLLTALAFFSFPCFAVAKSEKIDWKVCEKELKEFCTTVTSDHEKHECLEDAPKDRISKACHEFNKKHENVFSDKHDHN